MSDNPEMEQVGLVLLPGGRVMTLGLCALAAAIVLTVVLLVVRRVRESRRRLATWVCRICEEGFSELPAAEAHLMAVHHRTP